MRNLAIAIYLLVISTFLTKAKPNYSGKIEVGYHHFLFRGIVYEPGLDWKGYYLNEKQNAYHITSINGLSFANKRLFAGIGLGYQNFEGINGLSFFGDMEYLPLKSRLTPLLNLKLGYNHIWNQYVGGTGTMHTEFGLGLNLRIKEKMGVYLKSGLLITQESFFLPTTLGFRF